MDGPLQPAPRPRAAVLRSRKKLAVSRGKIRRLCALAEAQREARPKTARTAAAEAFRLASLVRDEPGAAEALFQLARAHHVLGDHLEALSHGQQSLKRFAALRDDTGVL